MDKQYTVVSKIIHGVSIEGYILENNEGKQQSVPVQDAIKLAQAEKISNAKAVLDTTEAQFIISITDGLDKLNTVRNNTKMELTLTCRIINDKGKCIGYKAQDRNGRVYNLSASKVWDLAINDTIPGIKAYAIENKKIKVLKSVGDFKLEDLPRVKG